LKRAGFHFETEALKASHVFEASQEEDAVRADLVDSVTGTRHETASVFVVCFDFEIMCGFGLSGGVHDKSRSS
jgi:hypothetical protein